MSVKSTPRLIVPAAGFGKRMGSPEAKEMLLNPRTGLPLIEGPLRLAAEIGWSAHVITRAEKRSLVEFLSNRDGVSVQLVDETKEWPDTVLRSKEHWAAANILILPDTVFEPVSALSSMAEALGPEYPLAASVFDVGRPQSWGMVRTDGDSTEFCEKPLVFEAGAKAWGLLGFTARAGQELFTRLLESSLDHKWKTVAFPSRILPLASFSDLTR